MDPYCKVGGLGDVMGTLPGKISKRGIEVKVIIPAYGKIDFDQFGVEKNIDNFFMDMANKKYEIRIHKLIRQADNNKYEILFLGNMEFFRREGIYTNETCDPYPDNFLRFLFFQRAALKYITDSNFQPDIIHCHDNQTALIPVYLKYNYNNRDIQNTKTVLTLHNIGYQSITEFHYKKYMDLPEKLFYPCQLLEWYGQINPLKAGILKADKVTTVSQGHAKEISNDERLSAGLMPVIKSREDEVVGILNGIDYDQWDPEKDEYINTNYSLADFDGKRENKKSLLEETDFSTDNIKIPLIGIVSRLVEQKGIELIINKMEDILSHNVRLIILGNGTELFQIKLNKLAHQYSSHLYIDFSYNSPFSHRIIAGSDILLMPSRYEPCGITQMIAMKYGTIPIAHKTGGLADTIKHRKTGFLFQKYSGEAMINAIEQALEFYRQPSKWENLMINSMNSDFSWDRSVEEYLELYSQVADNR